MTPPKKTEPKPAPQKEAKPEGPTTMKKATDEISSEFHKVEGKIKKLPVDRRIVFFLGLAMIVLSFLDIFGQWISAILGILVMYFSFTGKNPLDPNTEK
jgi:hypothetical protein